MGIEKDVYVTVIEGHGWGAFDLGLIADEYLFTQSQAIAQASSLELSRQYLLARMPAGGQTLSQSLEASREQGARPYLAMPDLLDPVYMGYELHRSNNTAFFTLIGRLAVTGGGTCLALFNPRGGDSRDFVALNEKYGRAEQIFRVNFGIV